MLLQEEHLLFVFVILETCCAAVSELYYTMNVKAEDWRREK